MFPCRSIRPDGDGGGEIGIPPPVLDELDLETGADGDLADLVYDRDEAVLEAHFNRDSVPYSGDRVRDQFQDLDLDEEQLDAIVDALA